MRDVAALVRCLDACQTEIYEQLLLASERRRQGFHSHSNDESLLLRCLVELGEIRKRLRP